MLVDLSLISIYTTTFICRDFYWPFPGHFSGQKPSQGASPARVRTLGPQSWAPKALCDLRHQISFLVYITFFKRLYYNIYMQGLYWPFPGHFSGQKPSQGASPARVRSLGPQSWAPKAYVTKDIKISLNSIEIRKLIIFCNTSCQKME